MNLLALGYNLSVCKEEQHRGELDQSFQNAVNKTSEPWFYYQ